MYRPRVRPLLTRCAVLAVCVAVASCTSSSPSSKAIPAPAGLPPFYAVPAGVADKAPGTLLKWTTLSAPTVHGSVRRVMYASTDARGRSVAVTGLVFVPVAPPPPGGYPVVSWAHGTNGMTDQCAPSLHPANALPTLTILNGMLSLGWEVVATDYQGEGTPPGLVPYLVGDVAGRNAIDIVLAARKLPSSYAGARYVVWGHSEGGQTALFAWDLGTTYGARSGVQMVGAVAGAPPSQLPALWQALSPTPYRVYLYMMLAGFNAAYGNAAAPLVDVLTPAGTALLPTLRQGCLASVASVVNASPFGEVVKSNPFDIAAWKQVLTKNDPASFESVPKVPLLIVHGAADEQIPVVTSAQLGQHLCDLGANLERWVYPDQNHGGVLIVSAVDLGHWILARFRGQASSAPAQPAGAAPVQAHTCR